MRISARGCQKTRDDSKKLQMYSKQWSPGDTMRVFYPIFWEDGRPEIAVGALWGHNVSDIKGLGLKTAFIPSQTDFVDGMPVGKPDLTYQFSMIAPVFVAGAKLQEEKNIMAKNFPSESARKEALKTIEEKYDSKNNMSAVKPVIGKAQFYISTEVVAYKFNNGQYDPETITLSSAPLSGQTIERLYTILNDPKYRPAEGEEWLEVEWKYPVNTDKGQSAKAAAPAGLTVEYRTPVQNAEFYKKVEERLASVATDGDSIVKRATRRVDPENVRKALMSYVFFHSEDLDAADEEGQDLVAKNASLIHELDAEAAFKNETLISKINEALKANKSATGPETSEVPTLSDVLPVPESTPVTSAPVQQAVPEIPTPTPVVQQVVPEIPTPAPVTQQQPVPVPQLVPGAPTVQQLLNNPNVLSGDDLEVNLDV